MAKLEMSDDWTDGPACKRVRVSNLLNCLIMSDGATLPDLDIDYFLGAEPVALLGREPMASAARPAMVGGGGGEGISGEALRAMRAWEERMHKRKGVREARHSREDVFQAKTPQYKAK